MLRRLSAAALWLAAPGVAWSLDGTAQKLADRYAGILAVKPEDAGAFERLWKVYVSAGETDQLLAQARANAGTNPLLSGRLLERGGHGEEARKILLPLTPGNLAAVHLLAGWLEKENKPAEAAALLDAAAAQHAQADVSFRAGELWAKAGEAAKSRAAWERGLTLAPQDLEARAKLARACAAAGDRAGAIAQWETLAREGPPSGRLTAWEEISRLYEDAGDWNGAISAQESLLGMLGPGHWKLDASRDRLFHLYEQAGRLAEYGNVLRQEAEAQPRDPGAALRVATFYANQGNATAELEWRRKALALQPTDAALLKEVTAKELAAGDLVGARETGQKLLTLQPHDADALFLTAEIAALQGDEKTAEAHVAQFLEDRAQSEDAKLRAQSFYERLRLAAPLEKSLTADYASHPGQKEAVIALARFYLRERRFDDAIQALGRFDDKALPPKEAAAAAAEFSTLLEEARLRDAALTWARRAVQKDPSSLEYALQAAELLRAQDSGDEAVALLRTAGENSVGTLPTEELDRRFFSALNQTSERVDPLRPKATMTSQELTGRFQKYAVTTGGDNAWLRLGRWRIWQNEPIAAEESLRAGIRANPQSQPLAEALATLMENEGNLDGAIVQWEKLEAAAPERSLEIRRRIGRLEINRGQPEHAQRLFQELLKEHPDDWQAAAELAAAQQAAENWFGAVDSWLAAYALAPADRRRTLRQPILVAMARLQLHERALTFLERGIVEEKNPSDRDDLLREAAIYARDHHLEEPWRKRLEDQIRAPQSEAFWRTGLAHLLREEGRLDEARVILAGQSVTPSPAVLEEMLKTAEQAEDFAKAEDLARRLALAEKTPSAAAWMRYADFQERGARPAAARDTWQTLARRFARNPEVLQKAAEFFEREGDETKAEGYYRQAAGLGAPSHQTLLKLGRMALARRDRDQAAGDFEALLKTTQPEPENYADSLPWPEGVDFASPANFLGNRRGWAASARPSEWIIPPEAELEGARLAAIRELGRLLANSPRKEAWAAGFTHPAERVWALYFTGDRPRALAECQKRADSTPAPFAESYCVLALEAGQGKELNAWAGAEPTASRWNAIATGLSFLLDRRWRPSSETLQELYGDAPAIERWQACSLLASRDAARQACELAGETPSSLPDGAASQAWLELSNWKLALRDPEGARDALDRSLTRAGAQTAYSRPFFSALRARWLLTPPEERAAFQRDILLIAREKESPGCLEATEAFLAALNGDNEAAAAHLQAFFKTLPDPQDIDWAEAVQQSGFQLEQWKLHRLARDLYRAYLTSDPVLLAMSEQNFEKPTQGLFVVNQLISAPEESIPYFLAEWRARGAGPEDFLQAARQVAAAGKPERTGPIIEQLCTIEPLNDSVTMGILTFTQDPALAGILKAYVAKILAGQNSAMVKAMAGSAGMRLALAYRQEGDPTGEIDLLERLSRDSPNAPAVVLQLAQVQRRLGRHAEALATLERAPAPLRESPASAMLLADLYANFGREKEAEAVLQRQLAGPNRLNAASRLKDLAALQGDQAALAAANRVLDTSPWEGDEPAKPTTEADWKKRLARLDVPGANPDERFQAGSNLLLSELTIPETLRNQELARLREIVDQRPNLQPRYYLVRKNLAQRLNRTEELAQQLKEEWNRGAGRYFAGEILLQLYLDERNYKELEHQLNEYLSDRSYRATAWRQVGASLLAAGQPRLAERVIRETRKRSDGDAQLDLQLAEALWKQGRSPAEFVAPVEKLATLDLGRRLDLARYYLNLNLPEDAARELRMLPKEAAIDSVAAQCWATAATEFLIRGRLTEAREAIQETVRRQADQVTGDLLATYYAATGELPTLEEDSNEFHLPPALLTKVQAAYLARLLQQERTDRVFWWLEKNPRLTRDAEVRGVLEKLEPVDPARAARIWDAAVAQNPLWEVQLAAAQFHLRRAQEREKAGESGLAELEEAHRLHPGNFGIAKPLVEQLTRAGKTRQATQTLEDVTKGYATPTDRRAAAKMLEALQTTPALPTGA